jgi:hypothetical protein
MAFSDFELARIQSAVGRLCERRSPPPHLRREVSIEYRVEGHAVTVFERRPKWRGEGFTEGGVARLRFNKTAGEWRLFWRRADLKWHSYSPLPSSSDLSKLVGEIDADPHACFFG